MKHKRILTRVVHSFNKLAPCVGFTNAMEFSPFSRVFFRCFDRNGALLDPLGLSRWPLLDLASIRLLEMGGACLEKRSDPNGHKMLAKHECAAFSDLWHVDAFKTSSIGLAKGNLPRSIASHVKRQGRFGTGAWRGGFERSPSVENRARLPRSCLNATVFIDAHLAFSFTACLKRRVVSPNRSVPSREETPFSST